MGLTAGESRLPDSKTGARLVPLSPPPAQALAELPRIEGNPWVIPGRKPGKHFADLNHHWDRVRAEADLKAVRIHDLRHSFASRALAFGESLSMIDKLLSHNKINTTARLCAPCARLDQGVLGQDRSQHRLRNLRRRQARQGRRTRLTVLTVLLSRDPGTDTGASRFGESVVWCL